MTPMLQALDQRHERALRALARMGATSLAGVLVEVAVGMTIARMYRGSFLDLRHMPDWSRWCGSAVTAVVLGAMLYPAWARSVRTAVVLTLPMFMLWAVSWDWAAERAEAVVLGLAGIAVGMHGKRMLRGRSAA